MPQIIHDPNQYYCEINVTIYFVKNTILIPLITILYYTNILKDYIIIHTIING